MELSEPAILAPRQELSAVRPKRPAGANEPSFADFRGELADKGFLVAAADDLIAWAHRLVVVDAVRTRMLRDRDDADGDASLRRRALWLCAARLATPV